MEQHSRQISRQLDEPQHSPSSPQSSRAWQASSEQAASRQPQQPRAESQQAAPARPQARLSPRTAHMDSSSQKRQARTQWRQQSAGTEETLGQQSGGRDRSTVKTAV